MEKKRITVIAVTGAFVLALAVFLFIAFGSRGGDTPAVVLPADTPSQGTAAGDPTDGDTALDDILIRVDSSTVRDVVAAMERPENYYASVTVTTHWKEGSLSTDLELWHSGEQSRVRRFQADGTIRNCLYTTDTVYVWYEGSDRVYTGPAGEFSVDDEMMLYSYEVVQEAGADAVMEANYSTYADKSCIYVRLTEGGTVTDLWIGTDSALLLCCERYVDGQVVYSMVLNSLSIGTVDESAFLLP